MTNSTTNQTNQSINLYDFLRSDGSIVVNKKLARIIGLDAAVIYSELVSKFIYWSGKGKLHNEKAQQSENGHFFYSTVDDLEESTTFKKDKQQTAIKKLVSLGMIEVKKMGLPSKRFFRIIDAGLYKLFQIKSIGDAFNNNGNENDAADKLEENPPTDNHAVSEAQNPEKPHNGQVAENPPTSQRKNRQPDGGKSSTNNTKLNNTKSNNTNNLNLSIPNEVLNNFVSKNRNRLTDDKIEIINHWLNKDILNTIPVPLFITKIEEALKPNIKSFKAYLTKCLNEVLKPQPNGQNEPKKAIREEIEPASIVKQKEENEAAYKKSISFIDDDFSKLSFAEQKAILEAELKGYTPPEHLR